MVIVAAKGLDSNPSPKTILSAGDGPWPVPCTANAAALDSKAVIHVEFDGVGGHAEARDFFHLERGVGVEHVIGEHPAPSQKVAVTLEVLDRLLERGTRMRNLRR